MSYATTFFDAPTRPRQVIPFEQNSMPFEVRTIEWVEKHRQQNNMAHRHNYYEIIWVTEGSGACLIDMDKHPLAPHTIYCIAPGKVHQLKPERPLNGYVISFSADFLFMAQDQAERMTGSHRSPLSGMSVVCLDEETRVEMEDILQRMLREYNNFFLLRSEILLGFFKIFLVYLSRRSETMEKPVQRTGNVDLVGKFLSFVDTHYKKDKKVTDYASHLAVTPNYLNEIVKKVSGFPASYHIQQRIVLEAKRHATYSSASMKEIAYQLGFEDIAHFSKFFKNVAGQSFSEFKKQVGSLVGIA